MAIGGQNGKLLSPLIFASSVVRRKSEPTREMREAKLAKNQQTVKVSPIKVTKIEDMKISERREAREIFPKTAVVDVGKVGDCKRNLADESLGAGRIG